MVSLRNEEPARNAPSVAIQAALETLGGRLILPTREAMAALGLPSSATAVSEWRRLGRLPFRERPIGGRFYTTARDVAEGLLIPRATTATGADATLDAFDPPRQPKRRRGRPRKVAAGEGRSDG